MAAHQIVQLIQRTTQPTLERVASQPATPTGGVGATSGDGDSAEVDGCDLPWAFVRFVVTGSASSPNAPVDEGFIPSRLIGAPVYPRASSITAGVSSGGRRSMRRWLPSAGGGAKERRQILNPTSKRNSKADMAPPIPLINVTISLSQTNIHFT